jgi:hypothetical protein
VPVGLRLLGVAFLPLVAGALTFAFNVVNAAWLQGRPPIGLMHGAIIGSLVLVGALSYRWTGRAATAVAMVIASICVTLLAVLLLLLLALSWAYE